MTYKKTVSPLGKNLARSFLLPHSSNFPSVFTSSRGVNIHLYHRRGTFEPHTSPKPPALGLAPTVAHRTDPPRKVQPVTTNWDHSPQHQRRDKTIGPLTTPTISVLGCSQEPSVFWGWWGIKP